jgi:alpha-1,3-rhamnosyl/mannosyltransferase
LPEIAGENAYFINPQDVSDIVQAMLTFAGDPAIREEYRQKGLSKARQFDWEKCAKETLEVYRKVAGNQ